MLSRIAGKRGASGRGWNASTEGEGNDAGVDTGWTDTFLHRSCSERLSDL